MSIFSYILGNKFGAKELVEKYNTHHDDVGKFTDSGSSRSQSGHAGMTQVRQYGKDHAKNQGAAVEASNVGRGRTNQGILHDVNSHFGHDVNGKLRSTQKGGVYPHADRETGAKSVQTVHSDITRMDRQKSGVLQAQTNDSLLDAAHMKAGLHGKNAVIFQSNPHAKAGDQTAKKIVLHAGKGTFTSMAHATKALEDAGLHGHATLHKTDSGYEVHIDVPKQHSPHGRGLQAMAVNFRRKHNMTAEHFNGERTLLRANNVDAKVKERLASKPEAAAKYAELKTKHKA